MMKRIVPPPPGMCYQLKDILEVIDMTPKQFAERAGLHRNTIKRIIRPDKHRFKVNYDTALIIARAVGLQIDQIDWPHGLSDNGRPPGSGNIVYVHHVRCGASYRQNMTGEICPHCMIELPVSGECGFC